MWLPCEAQKPMETDILHRDFCVIIRPEHSVLETSIRAGTP